MNVVEKLWKSFGFQKLCFLPETIKYFLDGCYNFLSRERRKFASAFDNVLMLEIWEYFQSFSLLIKLKRAYAHILHILFSV